MQTLHPRLGVEFSGRQKTQNANFASKVWALIFGQAEDPECKLCIQGLGLDFRQAEDPECKLCIQGSGLEFLGRQKTQNANLHPRFGP